MSEASEKGLVDHFRHGFIGRAAAPTAIAVAVVLLCLIHVSTPAWVWDETYYYTLSSGVGRWFADPAFGAERITEVFREGNAHPPLPLYAMAITGGLFTTESGDFLFAVRLATCIQFAALVVVMYLFAKREAGLPAALFAAALTALSPRLFAHSLMATYDVPMCLWCVATSVAFYRGMKSRRWAVASGFLFGLALLTKVNAFLLPLALWPWGLYFHRKRALPAIASMALAGPVVFFAGWPWLWVAPLKNFAEYIIDKFPAGAVPPFVLSWTGTQTIGWREPAETLYFGTVAPGGARWHYPFVMVVFTMPLAVMAGGAASAAAARKDSHATGLIALLWWSVFVQLAVFALVMTPFDGVRLFLPVLPLVSLAAGIGLARLWRSGGAWAAAAVVLAALSPGAEFFIYEPYGMSYFTPAVGGLPGAQELGMEVTYYGEAVDPGGFTAVNERARPGDMVAYGPMFKELPLLLPYYYTRYGILDPSLEPAAPSDEWDFLIWINRGGAITESDRSNRARGRVIHENRLLGVVLSQILESESHFEGGPDGPGQP